MVIEDVKFKQVLYTQCTGLKYFLKAQYVKCSISLEKLGIDCMPQWVEKSTKIHTTHWSKYCFLTLLRM